METSKNYQVFVDAIADLSATDIIRLRQFCERMKEALNLNDIRGVHCVQDFEDEMEIIDKIIENISTDEVCPKCGGQLYASDLPQYEYICPECDENFC